MEHIKSNRLLAGLLIVVLSFAVLPIGMASTSAVTYVEAVEWAQSQIGKYIDQDGAFGAQCVDLIRAYYIWLGAAATRGHGKDYARNTIPTGWVRARYNDTFIPEPGDIAVWDENFNPGYGHVGIVISADEQGITSIDQNYPDGSAVREVRHQGYEGFWGVVRPNFDLVDTSGICVTSVLNGSYQIMNGLPSVSMLARDETKAFDLFKFDSIASYASFDKVPGATSYVVLFGVGIQNKDAIEELRKQFWKASSDNERMQIVNRIIPLLDLYSEVSVDAANTEAAYINQKIGNYVKSMDDLFIYRKFSTEYRNAFFTGGVTSESIPLSQYAYRDEFQIVFDANSAWKSLESQAKAKGLPGYNFGSMFWFVFYTY